MRRKRTIDRTSIMADASFLWADAGMVMALRSWRVMAGGAAAQRELQQMVSEKVSAGLELAGALAGGWRARRPRRARRSASTAATSAATAAALASVPS